MAKPTDAEVRWLADTIAARMLRDAADHPRAAQLDDALRHWLPAEQLTYVQLVEVRKLVQEEWLTLVGAIDARLRSRVGRGIAKVLEGCEDRV